MSALSIVDEGKFPMDKEVEQIGTVTEIDTNTQIAYVEPDPDIAEAVLQGFGSGGADGDGIEAPAELVRTITDSEPRVAKDL